MRIPRQEGSKRNRVGIGIARQQQFGTEILFTPVSAFGITRASQFAQPRLECGRVRRGPVRRKAVQQIHGLDCGAPIAFGHFAPQFAQHGIVNIVSTRNLVRDTHEAFDVFALDGGIVRTGRFEHDLFQFGTGEALDFAIQIGR